MWSDNQKRIVCRLAFLLLCALPTGATVYRILHPQTADQWEQRLQSQLGVRTQIDSVETPGPYDTILRGLTFFDADNDPVLVATELRIQFGDVNQIWIDHPVRLTSDGFQHIVEQINQRVIRSHAVQPRWIVSVQSAVIESNLVMDDHFGSPKPRELQLEKLVIDLESGSDSTATRLDFQLVDPAAPNPVATPNVVSCFIERQRFPTVQGTASPQQRVILNTGNDALPCWLVNRWLPEIAENLGTKVTFSGGLEIDTGSPNLQGFAKGFFDNVDLEQVAGISGTTEHTTSARWGTIDLESFEFGADDVQHLAFLSIPGEVTPPIPIEKTLEVKERFDIAKGIHNAALEKYRRSSENTIRRRVTYPANIRVE